MKPLTPSEEEVMQYLWRLGPCTVKQLVEAISSQGEHKPAFTTVSTFIRILEEKGYVNHKAYGRSYEYFALVSKEQYGQRTLKKLMNEYFSGAPDQLVSFLVQKNELTPEQLQKLLDQLENSPDVP